MEQRLVDMAPRNPYGLALRGPVIGHAGAGLRPLQRMGGIAGLGALITAPIARRRSSQQIVEVPAGALIEPGRWALGEALRSAQSWGRLSMPLLPLLDDSDPRELAEMIGAFDEVAEPAGYVVLAERRPGQHIQQLVATCRAATPLPLLLALDADVTAQGQALAALEAGVDALVLLYGPAGAATRAGQGSARSGADPRVTDQDGDDQEDLQTPGVEDELMEAPAGPDGTLPARLAVAGGQLDGPVAEAQVLRVAAVLLGLGLPLAAVAGRAQAARDLLALGAQAIVLRAALWRDPALPTRIAVGLMRSPPA